MLVGKRLVVTTGLLCAASLLLCCARSSVGPTDEGSVTGLDTDVATPPDSGSIPPTDCEPGKKACESGNLVVCIDGEWSVLQNCAESGLSCTAAGCVTPDPCLDPDPVGCEQQQGVCQGAEKPTELCIDMRWAVCTEAVYEAHDARYEAAVETLCDGTDNDCDGAVDEDVFCAAAGGCDAFCASGGCQCSTGCESCDGGCRPTDSFLSDPAHCGGCGGACDLPHTEQHACVGGECAVAACEVGFEDVDEAAFNGCECGVLGEECNGVDDDCDGLVDEQTCDDGDACTVDACEPSTGCVHTSIASDCTDADPCTEDLCDPAVGCVFPDAPAGTYCPTGDEKCPGGGCQSGVCYLTTGQPCTTEVGLDLCSPVTVAGTCTASATCAVSEAPEGYECPGCDGICIKCFVEICVPFSEID